jgi:hypothetical protein
MEKQELTELADHLSEQLGVDVDPADIVHVNKSETAALIKNDEPKSRLTFKQTHELVSHCLQVPEQTYETWVAMAEAFSEKLGFKVTRYSLKMALEAAGRNLDAMLKPTVVLSPIEERIASLERRVKMLEDREPEVF